MGSTGKSTEATLAVAPVSQKVSSPVEMTDAQRQSIMNKLVYEQASQEQMSEMTAMPKARREEHKQLAEAAQRLIAYGGVPKLSQNYSAGVLFSVLPEGSVVEIAKSRHDGDNGTWIRGTSIEGKPMWTHLTNADGTKATSGVWKGTDDWVPTFLDTEKKTTLRVTKFGKG